MNPFEYVNSINMTKKDIMIDDLSEKAYAPFMINRSLSYFNDTVLMANEMNIKHHLDANTGRLSNKNMLQSKTK